MADVRTVISSLVAGVRPVDEREAADQADILGWIGSGQPVFRTAPPATPPKHLVSYFALVDSASHLVLLGDHVKAGLWLPSGGHVEDGEDPRHTVDREAFEELGIRAVFHDQLGAGRPFFLTVTPTLGENSHLDVSLWFVLACDHAAELTPDPREYRDVRWFPLDRPEGWPADQFDPEMGRFARKARTALDAGEGRAGRLAVPRSRNVDGPVRPNLGEPGRDLRVVDQRRLSAAPPDGLLSGAGG